MKEENILNKKNQESLNIKEQIAKYLIFWPWFVFSILICLGISFSYLRYATPIYNCTIKILLKDDKKSGISSELSAFSDIGILSPSVNLDNEIQVLKSYTLLEKTVKDLNLDIEYYGKGRVKESNLYGNTDFKVVFFNVKEGYNDLSTSIIIKKNDHQYFTLFDGAEKKIGTYKFNETIKLSNADLVITNLKGNRIENYTVLVKKLILKETVESYSNRLKLETVNRNSNIIILTLIDEVKDRAKDFLKTLVDNYNEDAVNDKKQVSKSTYKFINERIQLISEDLEEVESDVENFKNLNNITNIETETSLFLNKFTEIGKNILENETQINIFNELITYIDTNPNQTISPTIINLESGTIQTINQYNQLVIMRNNLLQNGAGVENLKIIEISKQLPELKRNLKNSLSSLKQSIEIQNADLIRNESKVKGKIAKIPSQEKRFRVIQRKQNIKEALYLYLLQKREETAISLAITSENSKIIDPAMSSTKPISPRSSIIFPISLLIGLLIPFGILYIIFLLDTKIHSKQDFDYLSPDIPVVGEIPFIDQDNRIITDNDRSILAESFRILRTNIHYLMPLKKEGECPVIYTCSSIKGEGKTFVSLNLALTLSTLNKKVILLGADLRNPQLHKYLNLNKNRMGLSNYLYDNTTNWKDLINENIFNNKFLDIIFAGAVPPNPAELLSNGRFEELLNILKKEYDYIVVDTAPTILVTDTLLISQLADVTVYVTRADHTEKKLLTYTKGLKEQGKFNNMSYVINNVGGSKGYGYGYGYGYNYGYNYGYGEDGDVKKSRTRKLRDRFKI